MTENSKKKVEVAEVKQMDIRRASISIGSKSALIMHKWAEKNKKMMLDKSTQKASVKKAKDPEQEYRDTIYFIDDKRIGFPAPAFKQAMIRGGKAMGLVMVDMQSAFFVLGEPGMNDSRDMVEIIPVDDGMKLIGGDGGTNMREDIVRLANKNPDLRYRAEVRKWKATLDIEYDASQVSFEQLVNMVNRAGFGVGIGDWRVEKKGDFGRFEVVA